MNLSKYFTFEELTASQFAARHGIDNMPKSPQIMANLNTLANKLDIVRDLLGKPMLVSSGYRCKELNTALNGSGTSTHMTGLAADFTCPGFGTVDEVFLAIKSSGIKYDQLILEFPFSRTPWVHIGFGSAMRQEKLTYNGKSYQVVA